MAAGLACVMNVRFAASEENLLKFCYAESIQNTEVKIMGQKYMWKLPSVLWVNSLNIACMMNHVPAQG